MSTKTKYRIEIKGRLTEGWEDWFNGSHVQVEECGDGSYVTCLESPAVDQTALHGMLTKIRDMNLTLLSVNPIVIASEGKGDFPG